MSGPLDGFRQKPLVAGAGAAGAAGDHLTAFGHELTELTDGFVVDAGRLLDTEGADLAPRFAKFARWAST